MYQTIAGAIAVLLLFSFTSANLYAQDRDRKVAQFADNIVFEGLTAHRPESVVDRLRGTPNYLKLSHPAAPLDEYINVVKGRLTRGLEHSGFPQSSISITPEGKQLIIRVTEGKRFLCGAVNVSGARDFDPVELLKRLTNVPPPAPKPFTFESEAKPKTDSALTQVTLNEMISTNCLWIPGKPAPLSAFAIAQLSNAVRQVFYSQGFLRPEFTVKPTLLPGGTANLDVAIKAEGNRATIASFEIHGATNNPPEVLLKFLNAKTGMVVNTALVRRFGEALHKSARYVKSRFEPEPLDDSGRINLRITVQEYKKAPRLDETFTTTDEIMMKARDWLLGLESRPESLVITAKNAFSGLPPARIVMSSQRGVIFLAGDDFESLDKLTGAIALTAEETGFYVPGLKGKFVIAHFQGQVVMGIEMAGDGEEDDSPFDFKLTSGVYPTRVGNSPYRLDVQLLPAAVLSLARLSDAKYQLKDGILQVTNEDVSARIDATGRLLGLRVSGTNDLAVSVEFVNGEFERVLKSLHQHTQAHRQLYDAERKVSSFLTFAISELPRTELFRSLLSEVVPATTLFALSSSVEAFRTADPFFPLNQVFKKEEAEPDAFFIPDSADSVEAAQNSMAQMLANWLIHNSSILFPRETWPQLLVREAGYVVIGHREYQPHVMEEILLSSDIGPIGMLAIGHALIKGGASAGRTLGEAGLQRLDADSFRKDCRILLNESAVCGQVLARFFRGLSAMSPLEIEVIAAVLPADSKKFLKSAAQALKADPNRTVAKSLEGAFEEYWESSLRAQVREALLELSHKAVGPSPTELLKKFTPAAEAGDAEAQHALGVIYAEGKGVPRDFAEAYKWLTLAARQGFPGARENQEKLSQAISPDEIYEGGKRARAFVPKAK